MGKDSASVGKGKAMKAKWIKMEGGKFKATVRVEGPVRGSCDAHA